MARDEVDDYLNEFKQDFYKTLDNRGGKKIRKIYKEEVNFMYKEYKPKNPKRRRKESDGFSDERNWDENIEISKSGIITYTLENNTRLHPTNLEPKYTLDRIIEKGTKRNPAPARPVYERTERRIAETDEVTSEIYKSLKRDGYEIY